jgi:hypothetical protein
VSWQAAMLRPNNKVSQCDAVPFSSTHYSNYYVQEEADDGVVMESSVPVKDVRFSLAFFYFAFSAVFLRIHKSLFLFLFYF